jgi:uncharacterized membrane protein
LLLREYTLAELEAEAVPDADEEITVMLSSMERRILAAGGRIVPARNREALREALQQAQRHNRTPAPAKRRG